MKLMRKLVFSLLAFLLAFFTLSVTSISAAKIVSDDKGTVTIAKGEIVNDDLFISAATAEIDGIVNGDVFIGAQTVRIPGTINGSLHIGAQTVDITGIVKSNVYVGAQNVSIVGSNIGGSLLAGAQNVNVDKDSVIGGSALAGAASLTIDSQVKRNVFAGAASLNIGSSAKIGKDLYYGTQQNGGSANVSDKAVITGTIHKAEANVPQKLETEKIKNAAPKLFNAVSTAAAFGAFLSSLIVAFIYFKLFGKHFNDTTALVTNSFWKSIGIGFLVIIALVPGLIILLITVVGIPVAGLAFLIFLIYSYLAKIVVGAALGNWLVKKINWKTSVYGACAFGLLTIFVISRIPFIGGLFGFVVFLAGLGALTINTFAKK